MNAAQLRGLHGFAHVYDCDCGGVLRYKIARDAYACDSCEKEFEVLSVEHDHVLYDGGPPREVKA